MISPDQLRDYIIQPTLKYLHPQIPYSEDAVELLLMTAAHESHLGSYIKQVKGPAEGIYQMEPATETDIWNNFLEYKRNLKELISETLVESPAFESDLIGNMYYSTAMARVHYYRAPEKLPSRHSPIAMAAYAKKYFNTFLGKATEEQYQRAYEELVLGKH